MESVQQLPPSVRPQTTTQVRGGSGCEPRGRSGFSSSACCSTAPTSCHRSSRPYPPDSTVSTGTWCSSTTPPATARPSWRARWPRGRRSSSLPVNRGYAAGINAGVAAHPGHHTAVLVLNPDVRLAPGCGRTLLAALRETHAGIAVPVLRDERGHLLHSIRREPTVLRQAADTFIGARTAGRIGTLGELVATRSSYRTRHVVDWAEGALLLIDAGCMAATGGWDEAYFLYSEETDFALRARDLGYATVFEPAAEAVHLRGGILHRPRPVGAAVPQPRARLPAASRAREQRVLLRPRRAPGGQPRGARQTHEQGGPALPARPAADASTARSLVRPAQSGGDGGHRPGHARDDHLLGAGLLVPQPRALGCAAGPRAVRRPAGAARQQPGHADAPPRHVDPTDPPDPAQGGQQLARCAPAREQPSAAAWS